MDIKSFALGYNAGASKSGGSVSQAELEAAIKAVVPEWALAEEPPEDAVTSVNGQTGEVKLTIPSEASDVDADPAGAAESMTNALREEVNTILGDYAKSTAIVDKIYWHNVSYMSHEDIRANVTTLRTMIETVVGTDTGKSMRAVAALVVAEIVGDASDSFDTLEEIAAWIEAHPNDVAAMVKRITDLEAAMGGKVSKTDIINTLDSTALDKPLSAAMGKQLAGAISQINETLAGKTNVQQVSDTITAALKDYLTTAKAAELYQPKGDYLTPTAAAPIINTEVDKVVTERKEELRGKDGKTPEAGVDYPTAEQVDSYIAAELAKRNQFVPIPAASVEDMTDTTKIYYLTATGELYAYAPAQVVVGGYTNLADPTSSDWKTRSRLNASAVIASASSEADRSFVSNQIPATNGQTVRIKGVTATTNTAGTATNFTAVLYDSSGTQLNTKPFLLKQPVSGSGFSTDTSHHSWNAVHVTDDGVYEWKLGLNNGGGVPHPSVASFRVSGLAVTSAEDIIITVGQEIKDPEIVTEYAWAGTGHFISSEEAITALESRVNVLEDEVEELTVTVDRLKTNSSISMQSGAVWYAFGDSITEGYISYLEEDGTASCKLEPVNQHSWVYTVAKLNGYELTNYAVGGTGYAQVKSGASTAREQVDAVDFTGCDLVTFAWGCNDWKYNAGPIGSKDDDKDTATTTCAALKWCIERVLSQNPLCKILVITPINVKRGTFEGNYGVSYEFSNTGSLQDVFEALVGVCESYGIEYIDMTHSSVVNRSNISALLLDTVHPTPEAYKAMGKELARKINFA